MIPQLPENNVVKLTTLFFRNASERKGISMYMTNEEWEPNNQDYLKESYEETGFITGGSRKLKPAALLVLTLRTVCSWWMMI